jgi:hypothetical protein
MIMASDRPVRKAGRVDDRNARSWRRRERRIAPIGNRQRRVIAELPLQFPHLPQQSATDCGL